MGIRKFVQDLRVPMKTIAFFYCQRQICGIPWTVKLVSYVDESSALGDTMATDLSLHPYQTTES